MYLIKTFYKKLSISKKVLIKFGLKRVGFLLLLAIWATNLSNANAATQIDINGPAGSGIFGTNIVPLPNGNIVVVDSEFDSGGTTDVGAVYTYNGANSNLISVITGVTQDDFVGSSGIEVLANGNFVIKSQNFDNGGNSDVGAVTFCSGTTGCSGTVNATNSLVGSTSGDRIGNVATLPNGNYVVNSNEWDSGGTSNVGAVTFCSGTTGCVGTISSANSLIGSTANDRVGGFDQQKVLANGNYIVSSPEWDNGGVTDVGAVTFCDGTTGCSGVVSSGNSLIGSTAGDSVGSVELVELTNGNYLVGSQNWDNGTVVNAGAATLCSGTTGCVGTVSAGNSLVGTTNSDLVGSNLFALTNGNYVVNSNDWDDGGTPNVGASTFCNGTTGCTGAVTNTNSLVGTINNDGVGSRGIIALTNGNYVVMSNGWNNNFAGGQFDVGAATFCSGTSGCTGPVTIANSLHGSTSTNNIGSGGIALSNGDYVLNSQNFDNASGSTVGAVTYCSGTSGCTGAITTSNSLIGGTAGDGIGRDIAELSNGNFVFWSSSVDIGGVQDVGAVTFCNVSVGCPTGTVSAANSLVGTTASDRISSRDVFPLTNGNYVVASHFWDNGGTQNVGAVTMCDGTSGCIGSVTTANSLHGSTANDSIGDRVVALTNNNYIVASRLWDNSGIGDAGAVTHCTGTTGCIGAISSANSLVGGAFSDNVGDRSIVALSNGDYVVHSGNWDRPSTFLLGDGSTFNAGAITCGDGTNGTTGLLTSNNSVAGTLSGQGGNLNFKFDTANNQLVVGKPSENRVTLFRRLAPTAANASISGRVITPRGRAIPHAIVNLTAQNGKSITARTNQFGYFRFEDIEVGQTLVMNVFSKNFQFRPQVINLDDSISGLEIVGDK